MENENGEQEALNPDENTELEPESEGESAEALKEKLLKAEEVAKNQRIRAEKAEAEAKKLKGEPTPKNTEVAPKNEMSIKNIRALNSVHDDDVDFIVNWAKSNNIEIADAVKNKDVQLVLKGHEEERKTAEATNTGGGRGGSPKVSEESLLLKANKGDLPESEEGIAKLIEAKRKQMAKR